jgi:LacI family transcriptional regulator
MAAEYFLGRGYARYATVGPRDHQYSKDRCGTFAQLVGEAGYECPHFYLESWSGFADEQAERRQFDALCHWARQLVAPTAVFCCNDLTTRDVMAACEAVDRKVPEQVALLGVDNDDLICELSTTPLSSIDACGQRVGFEAASLLAAMMRGQPPPAGRLLITPAGVVTRRSSNILAVGDPEVASAMRFIHDHADRDLGVEDVVAQATCSRRNLERRFRAAIGRSVNQEIQRCRLDRAMRLLAGTDLTVQQINDALGFRYVHRLNDLFRRLAKTTPKAYRAQFRRGSRAAN